MFMHLGTKDHAGNSEPRIQALGSLVLRLPRSGMQTLKLRRRHVWLLGTRLGSWWVGGYKASSALLNQKVIIPVASVCAWECNC